MVPLGIKKIYLTHCQCVCVNFMCHFIFLSRHYTYDYVIITLDYRIHFKLYCGILALFKKL